MQIHGLLVADPPGNKLINPDSWKICISAAQPPHPGERKVTAPIGLEEIMYFTVECFL